MFEDAKACAEDMRAAMRAAGIDARCRVLKGSRTAIQVFPTAYETPFAEPAQRTIRAMAVTRRLTLVRGLPIDVERMTDPHGMEFHLPAEPIGAHTPKAAE